MNSLIDRLLPGRRTEALDEAPGWSLFYSLFAQQARSAAGIQVTGESAMRQATVFACVKVLAETLGTFPVGVYKRVSGMREQQPKHPLNYTITIAPNSWQTPIEFFEMMQGHLALRGNAYARIVPGIRGAVTELWPMNPDKVVVHQLSNKKLQYTYKDPATGDQKYLQDEILHVRGLSSDGLVGLSPLHLARDTIGNALAAERFQGKLFQNGVLPSGYIKGPPALQVKDAKVAQQTLMEAYSGEGNWHKPMVLWGGMEWNQMALSNDDAQFLDLRKLSRNEICAIFRMPPHKVSDLEKATYNNLEESNLQFVTETMLPWVRRWEEAMARDLLADSETFCIRFNFKELLRGNHVARAQFYHSGIVDGWLAPNDCRDMEDLPPYDDGDEFFIQGAMVTVSSVVNPPPPPPPPEPTKDEDEAAEEQAPDEKESTEDEKADNERQLAAANAKVDVLVIEYESKVGELALKDQQLARLQADLTAATERAAARGDELATALADRRTSDQQLSELTTKYSLAAAEQTRTTAALDEATQANRELEASIGPLRAKLESAADEANNLIRSCVVRMTEIEIEGIERLLAKSNGLSRVDSFYSRHADRMIVALDPLFKQLAIVAACQPVEEVVASWVEDSKARLLSAFKGPHETAADRIRDCLATWDERSLECHA